MNIAKIGRVTGIAALAILSLGALGGGHITTALAYLAALALMLDPVRERLKASAAIPDMAFPAASLVLFFIGVFVAAASSPTPAPAQRQAAKPQASAPAQEVARDPVKPAATAILDIKQIANAGPEQVAQQLGQPTKAGTASGADTHAYYQAGGAEVYVLFVGGQRAEDIQISGLNDQQLGVEASTDTIMASIGLPPELPSERAGDSEMGMITWRNVDGIGRITAHHGGGQVSYIGIHVSQ